MRDRISISTYVKAKEKLDKLNENGFTPERQKQIDKAYEREMWRIQITWGTMK